MNSHTVTAPHSVQLPAQTPAAARTVFQLLQRLRHGSLTVQLPDGSVQTLGDGQGLHATIHLHNWNVCGAALKSGDIGFAESYIAGDWTTPHLDDLLRLFLANRQALEDVIHGSWAGRLLYRLRHLLHRNTRRNSRKNIHAHYDLGNAFYRLWLDGTMNYSSALFEGGHEQPMADAQHAKVRRALRMAGVRPGDRVLEIGCGWGALAEKGTVEFGAHVTGVTLSTEQLAWAQQRLAALGQADRADLRLQDYRDIADGPFDAICSIEMVEAVGREYWPTYFGRVAQLLKPGGRACIQSIVIQDRLFDRYIRSTDFIQQYIFPGGCLPCPREFRREAEAAGLRVVDEFAFGADYAETCRRWREDFLARRDEVLALGFDERFLRIWEFYLAYCEAGFASGDIDVVQYTLAK
ncbi:cyclopropane-fatty-acyl-phospholipid synthase family protein [Aquabacterium sp. A08]|uniref:SAM-dependent methyltransferase n=1 Tax=Aquabacterium sp. A08 TaxID=2718532 RepID=UPI0014228020|nr:cyclopropane-fatty-acyl-phospholipid synthase family protein [Aquabacterium sp. A08]NIC40425.1 class I SAM-dependent methyltransferase [Aquabacterium sp. A08]